MGGGSCSSTVLVFGMITIRSFQNSDFFPPRRWFPPDFLRAEGESVGEGLVVEGFAVVGVIVVDVEGVRVGVGVRVRVGVGVGVRVDVGVDVDVGVVGGIVFVESVMVSEDILLLLLLLLLSLLFGFFLLVGGVLEPGVGRDVEVGGVEAGVVISFFLLYKFLQLPSEALVLLLLLFPFDVVSIAVLARSDEGLWGDSSSPREELSLIRFAPFFLEVMGFSLLSLLLLLL